VVGGRLLTQTEHFGRSDPADLLGLSVWLANTIVGPIVGPIVKDDDYAPHDQTRTSG
jgi:hypothetical protein